MTFRPVRRGQTVTAPCRRVPDQVAGQDLDQRRTAAGQPIQRAQASNALVLHVNMHDTQQETCTCVRYAKLATAEMLLLLSVPPLPHCFVAHMLVCAQLVHHMPVQDTHTDACSYAYSQGISEQITISGMHKVYG
jgi:hypothetical protein